MENFKLSLETDDPEVFLKALALAAVTLDLSTVFCEAVSSESSKTLEGDLTAAINYLTRCANSYHKYKQNLAEEA
jgi:hypothetical protein